MVFLQQALSESSKKENTEMLENEQANTPRVIPPLVFSFENMFFSWAKLILQTTGNGTSEEDESSYSSFYSSFLKTSSSSNDGRADNSNGSLHWEKEIKFPIKRPIPSWVDAFESSGEELVYKCRLNAKTFTGVLNHDNKEFSQVRIDLNLIISVFPDFYLFTLSAGSG